MIGRGESYEWLGLYDNFEEAVSVYRLAHIKKWGKFSPYLHDTPNFMPITRELDYIKRWQIVRTIRQQTVAAHSYYVSLYFIELCKVSGIALTPEAIAWVLEHDFEETHTGDIPTPAKENITFNNVKRTNQYFMNKDEYKIFKMADLLDALFFLIEERLVGNKTVKMVESEVEGKLLKMCGEGSLKEYIVELIDAHRSYQGRVK
jgi:5'-deoxynucleotidase YfbR-like HD superfamily hydrolase